MPLYTRYFWVHIQERKNGKGILHPITQIWKPGEERGLVILNAAKGPSILFIYKNSQITQYMFVYHVSGWGGGFSVTQLLSLFIMTLTLCSFLLSLPSSSSSSFLSPLFFLLPYQGWNSGLLLTSARQTLWVGWQPPQPWHYCLWRELNIWHNIWPSSRGYFKWHGNTTEVMKEN